MTEKIAYICCALTNPETTVFLDENGDVIPDAEGCRVVGFRHPDGPSACNDWIHDNKELSDLLKTQVITEKDVAVGPAGFVTAEPAETLPPETDPVEEEQSLTDDLSSRVSLTQPELTDPDSGADEEE